jgi:hypothetical protein
VNALQSDVEGLVFCGVLALVMLAVALLARRDPLSATLLMAKMAECASAAVTADASREAF